MPASEGTLRRSLLRNVQGLRGLACLVVVVYHLGSWEKLFGPRVPLLGWIHPFGFCVVDIFFVVSGFILTWTHFHELGRPAALGSYAVKRLTRVYPVLWAYWLLALLIHVRVFGDPAFAGDWPTRWAGELTLLWSGPEPQLPPAWTLLFEVSFYLGFAIFFLVPRRFFVPLLSLWTGAVVVFLILPSVTGWLVPAKAVQSFALEFLCGCWACVAAKRTTRGGTAVIRLGLLGFALAGVWCWWTDGLAAASWWRAAVYGPCAALLVYGLTQREFDGRLYFPPWMQWVGGASYSIYLTHWTIGGLVLNQTINWSHNLLPNLGWVVLMLAAMVGGGCGCHQFIERPLMRLFRKKKPKPTVPAAAAPPLRAAA